MITIIFDKTSIRKQAQPNTSAVGIRGLGGPSGFGRFNPFLTWGEAYYALTLLVAPLPLGFSDLPKALQLDYLLVLNIIDKLKNILVFSCILESNLVIKSKDFNL